MKKRIRLARLLQLIFVLIFICSSVILISNIWRGYKEQQAFIRLSNHVSETTVELPEKAEQSPAILPKYAQAYRENSDIFGWISISDTAVDYPVMYTPDDPEHYLRTAFDGTYAVSGVPFLDANCYIGCGNYIIYGHHMKNGTMFSDLLHYADIEYWKQHPSINFDTLYEQNEYEVVAAFYTRIFHPDEADVFRYYDYTDLTDKNLFDDFVEGIKDAAMYDTGISVEYGDNFITLSTCSYHTENGRFVVVAKEKAK